MKVIIIEDESLSAEYLENLLKKIDSAIEVISVIDSVKKSIELLSNGVKADLLFVDVHLADGLSFEIFSKVNTEIPLIFTTAYDEYAIKAFKLNSVDYLLKPIAIADLRTAIEKHKRLNLNFKKSLIEDLASAYQNQIKQYKNRFMVKLGDTITSVKTEEISHFVSEDGMVMLATVNGKRYTLDYTLDNLENILDPDFFFRINRKVIIHISSISKVGAYFNSRLKINFEPLKDEDGIVSRERVNDFKKWLDK
jgi:DNA-binding LytR/AlgR family response regulator